MALKVLTNVSFLVVGLIAGLALAGIRGHAQTPAPEDPNQQRHHEPLFIPKRGGVVVLYSHHFKKEDWKEARAFFQKNFYKKDIQHDRDVRDSYIVENPEKAEILGITLWRSAKDLEDWEKEPGRNKHLRELDKFRSEPFKEERYKILDEILE